jgi:hypothetical protein
MELLIVLGLCFGAYELLGVFQGCFHYNDHPLPYQPQQYIKGSDSKDTDNENETERSAVEEFLCEKKQQVRSEIRRKIQERRKLITASIHQQLLQHQHQQQEEQDEPEDEEEEEEEEEEEDEDEEEEIDEQLKSGPCSCYSTEEDFDDDTRTILRNCRSKAPRKQINKYSLSKSLMSLNRDDSSFLLNILDDANNNSVAKFTKFRSQLEISETSFSRCGSVRSNSDNEKRHTRRVCRDTIENLEKHNESNECNASSAVSLDTNNKKKIFFISAAS